MCSRSGKSVSGRFTHSTTTPRRWSIGDGTPKPIAAMSSEWSSSTAASSSRTTDACESCRGRALVAAHDRARLASTTPARIFVPPRSTPIACVRVHVRAGTVTRRMAASGEKPYRVYKGGRTKGKVPLKGGAAKGERKTYRSGAQRRQRRQRPPGRAPPEEELDVEALDVGLAARALHPARRSGRSPATCPSRAASRTRTSASPPMSRPSSRSRTRCSSPRARTSCCSARPLEQRPTGTELGPALGLDDAAPYRSEPSPARVPLDPARPARVDPGLRRAEDQRGDADRRPEARRRDGGRALRLGPADQPRRRRRLRRRS